MGEHTKINPGPFIEFLNNVCPAILGAPKAVFPRLPDFHASMRVISSRLSFPNLQDEISRHFASLEMMNKVRHFIYDDQDTTFFIARELVRILVLLASSGTPRADTARCHQVDREDKKEDGKSSEASLVVCVVHVV